MHYACTKTDDERELFIKLLIAIEGMAMWSDMVGTALSMSLGQMIYL